MNKVSKGGMARLGPVFRNGLIIAVTYLLLVGMLVIGITPEQHDIQVGAPAPLDILASKDVTDTVTTEERRAALRRLEKRSAAERQTQILIETPYRNDSLFADILATCGGKTLVTVAANLTQPDAFVRTRSVAGWKEHPVTIGKRPCVFLILA